MNTLDWMEQKKSEAVTERYRNLEVDKNIPAIQISNRLTAEETVLFVNFVIENSKTEDRVNTLLIPFAFDVALVIYFTNIRLPEDIGLLDLHDFVTFSGIAGKIKSEIPNSYIDDLNLLIQKKIDTQPTNNIPSADELIDRLRSAVEGFDPSKLEEVGKAFQWVSGDFTPANSEPLINEIQKETGIEKEKAIELLNTLAMKAAGEQHAKGIS